MTLVLPPVIAHRGASATAPENTLAAVRAAVEAGASWVEVDVRLAACGTPVLLHDRTLERTTNGRGRVAEQTSVALAKLDAGGWFGDVFVGEAVPTLDDLLRLATQLGVGLNVEIKAETDAEAERTAERSATLLRGHGGPLVVSSFLPAALAALVGSGLRLGLLCGYRVRPADLQFARKLGAVSLHADRRAFGAELAAAIAAADLWSVAYTVNEVAEAQRLWRLGVESLITDRPGDLIPVAPSHA